ncbi:GNAT family N-acetyltransferase [Elioraea thermophila]|uniref:GNAT family N-acetyltransferase n=1 Tax=Elioraea thermophila TaxID=2185104 RepID=UPI000DF1D463|nr:GNAT family N-acetyltransferase [Elioraea thermophila]
MGDRAPTLSLDLVDRIADVAAADWDGCAGDDNPFVSHAFLSCLEDSGSASPRTGWLPRHAVLRDAAGRVVAVAPLYVKSHSWGEYVFDHAWADALERAGGRYYPKLQVAVPFSPVPGPRLLSRDPSLRPALATGLPRIAHDLRLSSVHVTFCTGDEQALLEAVGFLPRLGLQFHWRNEGYATFDDFLGRLASRKRKQVRKERERARWALRIRPLRGREITPRHWEAFHAFYLATVDKRWGQAYLTRRFWPMLGESLGDRVVLMWAEEEDGTPVAGALNLLGRDALFGRNWGAAREVPFLHFELCYYQAIEFAIAHGLARVEAGAQGEHKVSRGYLPVPTFSAHWIAHEGLREAVARFLARERPALRETIARITEEQSPFREESSRG